MDHGTQLKLLKYLQEHPKASQRELAGYLGVSLGKANYCLKALIEKGQVKARNFKNNKNKRQYLYLLTPAGMDAKARITVSFLQRKMQEHEELKREIRQLQQDVRENNNGRE
jgi:EPS-associated MarR family transcriptional regulator